MCLSCLNVFKKNVIFFLLFRFTKPTSNRRKVSTTTEARADHTIRFMNETKRTFHKWNAYGRWAGTKSTRFISPLTNTSNGILRLCYPSTLLLGIVWNYVVEKCKNEFFLVIHFSISFTKMYCVFYEHVCGVNDV